MKKKTKFIVFAVIIFLLLPLWMWIGWLLTPHKKLVLAIVDKTEITKAGQEHISLNWILNHERYTKTASSPYGVTTDYFGFFPMEKETFKIKGLERFSDQQMEQLSNDCNAVYFTDTYGVFSNEWYTGKNISERSAIVYGGMSKEDISMLKKMKDKHKLIMTEFNSIGSPTNDEIRHQFENLFSVQWSGWIGRYFESLDTSVNKELPHWLINNYLTQHNHQWPFSKPGIAFVSNKDEVVILEDNMHLTNAVPHITTAIAAQSKYNLPKDIKYSFWFDVMNIDSAVNKVTAYFNLDVNDAGKQILNTYHIPSSFPAVISHSGNDYTFYYFCADFCDNPINLKTSYFKGISLFKSFFYNSENVMDRKNFFWNYYRPLITQILSEQYKKDKH